MSFCRKLWFEFSALYNVNTSCSRHTASYFWHGKLTMFSRKCFVVFVIQRVFCVQSPGFTMVHPFSVDGVPILIVFERGSKIEVRWVAYLYNSLHILITAFYCVKHFVKYDPKSEGWASQLARNYETLTLNWRDNTLKAIDRKVNKLQWDG